MYDGMSYELMSVGIVDRDLVEEIPHFKESPLVQKVLAELEEVYRSPNRTEQSRETEVSEPIEIPSEPLRPVKEEGETVEAPSEPQRRMQEDKKSEQREKADDVTVVGASGGRRESVLQALRDRQAKLKAKEPEKAKQKTQNHKKGDQAL